MQTTPALRILGASLLVSLAMSTKLSIASAAEVDTKKISATICGTVIRIIDGDTFIINISDPENIPDILARAVPIRIRGIDTPELHSKADCLRRKAMLAKKTLAHLLPARVCLQDPIRDKYWRLVASVTSTTGKDIATSMLKLKLALPYTEPLTKPTHSCADPLESAILYRKVETPPHG